MKALFTLVFVGLSSLVAASTEIPPLTVGQEFPAFQTKDQHDKEIGFSTSLQWVVFTKDKAGSNVANKTFEGKAEADFAKVGILYMADISGMPGLITRMVALPKMRKYTYRVALDRDGKLTGPWPHQGDSVTLMKLQSGTLGTIQYIKTSEELAKALGI